MSSRPVERLQAGRERRPMTLPRLAEMKRNGEPIVMVTAYDHPGVDLVLIGASAANNVLGYETTVPVAMEEMLMLARAVRRGLTSPLLIGDLPFGSYEGSNEIAVENAQRFVKEAGCDAVKLERGGGSVDRARAIIRAGIPVMGHVGLTPQTATTLGGYRAQGRTAGRAAQIAEEALALQAAGCFAIVFEAIPAGVSEALVEQLEVPVIGIGAGGATDGQVLVFHDLLGLRTGRMPRFVKQYARIHDDMVRAVSSYADDVRARRFPDPDHSYAIDADELEEFKRYLDQESLAGSAWDW